MEDNKYNKKVLFDTKFVICLIIIANISLIMFYKKKNSLNEDDK